MSRPTSHRVSQRVIRWLAAPPALALWLGACSTPPKPTALIAYEDLRRDPATEEAIEVASSFDRFAEAAKTFQKLNPTKK